MTAFEDYSLDQFPLRDTFRTIKARVNHDLLGQKDNHGYYLAEGYLSKLEYPLNEGRVRQSLAKQQQVYDTFLKEKECRIFYSIIPDKNYYLAERNGYPAMDYNAYVKMVQDGISYGEYIDIFDTLQLESYYRTDQHFRQECLKPLTAKLEEAMQMDFTEEYEEHVIETPFYGAYYSQAALPCEPDKLVYLTNDILDNCEVTSYNTGVAKPSKMYDLEKATGKDGYEMYLSGSDAFLVIENPMVNTNKELVIFRDSFGSSLAPLLVPAYAKVTLVDLRYLRPEMIGQLMEFDNQDVLFIYSTLVF